MIQLMNSPQSGIFALGTSSHAYVEFDLRSGGDGRALAMAIANLREPRTTIGGVNLVAGFRPELWRALRPEGLPAELAGFNHDLVGPDGYLMPATQHDAVLWRSRRHYRARHHRGHHPLPPAAAPGRRRLAGGGFTAQSGAGRHKEGPQHSPPERRRVSLRQTSADKRPTAPAISAHVNPDR
jgi:hypothetical protein